MSNDYAASNLETIKSNISAYVSYAEGVDTCELEDKQKAVEQALQELIDLIRGNEVIHYKGYRIRIDESWEDDENFQVCIYDQDDEMIDGDFNRDGTYEEILDEAKSVIDRIAA